MVIFGTPTVLIFGTPTVLIFGTPTVLIKRHIFIRNCTLNCSSRMTRVVGRAISKYPNLSSALLLNSNAQEHQRNPLQVTNPPMDQPPPSSTSAFTQLQLQNIEQLGTGAVFCQLLDVVHPGRVPLSKVNWKAKTEYDNLYNLKLLTTTMNSLKINKQIDVSGKTCRFKRLLK